MHLEYYAVKMMVDAFGPSVLQSCPTTSAKATHTIPSDCVSRQITKEMSTCLSIGSLFNITSVHHLVELPT